MPKTTLAMAVAAVGLSVLAYMRGGFALVTQGVLTGGRMLLEVAPLLLVAFLVAGLIQTLVSKEMIAKWLGKEAGAKGLLLGAVAGALVPGGPYVFYPIAASFFLGGAEIGTVLAFVTAKNLWTLSRVPMEVALIGPQITLVRYVITLPFPLVVGLAANYFFPGLSDKIREQVGELNKRGEEG